MLYVLIPIFVLMSAFYFYPKNRWKPFYNVSWLLSAVAFMASVVSFMTIETAFELRIPYIYTDFYIVSNVLSLYMVMGVYGILFCSLLFFRYPIFSQIHHFEKMIVLWLYTLFIVFSVSSQNILQVLFAWAGCAVCIFTTSVYRDDEQVSEMPPMYALLAYIIPLVASLLTFTLKIQYTVFGNIVFFLSLCSMLGVFPLNTWIGRFLVQGKLYAVIMCVLKTVLAVKFIQIYVSQMPPESIFNQTPYFAMFAVLFMLVGAMVVYNQMDIFRRLAYIFGVFSSMGVLSLSILPLSYTMVLMLCYMWIYMAIAGILCVVHYMLSGERDISYMGGVSQHSPILYMLYFVILMGIGYIPMHSMSFIMGKAVYMIGVPMDKSPIILSFNMDLSFITDMLGAFYPVYQPLSIGALFLIAHFVFCYGFGRMGALIFTQEYNASDMVTAYLKKPSKSIFIALLLILALAILFGSISNNMMLPLVDRQWQYGNILYVVLVATSILGFSTGMLSGMVSNNKDIKISPVYRRNLYVNESYRRVADMIVDGVQYPFVAKHKDRERFYTRVEQYFETFKTIFTHSTKSPYGMGYRPLLISTLLLLLILIGYKI